MKNRVEKYFAASESETLDEKLENNLAGKRMLTESTISVQYTGPNFAYIAAQTLADVIESLNGRSIEYHQTDAPTPFDRAKFVSYHTNPLIWDAPHSFRAGMLELDIGTKSVMPTEYDASKDSFEYDPNASQSLADEPSAHIVWHFPERRFDGYLLKNSQGQLKFVVLSDTPGAFENTKWISTQVAERFGAQGYRVNVVTRQRKYEEEL